VADPPGHPHADASVRRAIAADARDITRIQAEAWRPYALLLSNDAAATFDATGAESEWRASIESPPTAQHRVFVALLAGRPVGFAASAPARDEDLTADRDGELLALHVLPGHTRGGHGSRLMAAVVDSARDDGLDQLVCWVFAADDPMRLFLQACGWDADGSTRDLDAGQLVHQVRLHTLIGDPDDVVA
jgi:GNAT superfamily N-acetyltransferase